MALRPQLGSRSSASLLSRSRDFRRLWVGETVSAVGSQVTLIALPLVAVSELGATPTQMGLLGAAQTVPFLLFATLAGVWVDRNRKLPILIWAHRVKAAVLASVPALALAGLLSMTQLLLIAFAVGCCTVLFEVAYQSYLPVLVDREDLVEANSRLSASASAAEIGGPGLGGLLVSAVTAPLAIAADAASFLFSAATLGTVQRREDPPAHESRTDIWRGVAEGFRTTIRNRYLLAFAGEAATYNVAWNGINALLVLWAVQDLGLTPAVLGALLSVGSAGALVGALLTGRLADRFGIGRAMWVSALISNVGVLLIPLTTGNRPTAIAMLGLAFFVQGLGMTGTNVHTYAIRQAVTPPELLGRANAAYRALTYGCIPLGALVGGLLGDAVGLRTGLLIGAIALFPSWLWLFYSPARSLRSLPDPGDRVGFATPVARI